MRGIFRIRRMSFEYALHYELPMVYASSASVYGTGRVSIEEPEYERPINVYAYSKLTFDQYMRKNFKRAKNTVVWFALL